MIAQSADAVAQTGDIDRAKEEFAQLSNAMIEYRRTSEESPKPVVGYCPMVDSFWLQPEGPVDNPYDKGMRSCGEIRE